MDTLTVLLWLKLKLQWRSYMRNTSTIIGIVAFMFIFAPMAFVLAAGCYMGFILAPPVNRQILAAVLFFGYLIWFLLPIFRSSLTEGYDPTRLFHFPVSPRLLFAGAVIGSFVDLFSLLAAPTFIAVIVAFTKNLVALPIILLAMLLFVFHTLALSQAIVLAGAGILRSRRFRDVLIFIIPFLSMGIWLGMQILMRRSGGVMFGPNSMESLARLFNRPGWQVIDFLPPGWAARAVADAGEGRFVGSLVFLALLAVACVGTVYVAGWLVNLVSSGHVVSAPVKRARTPERVRTSAPDSVPSGVASLLRSLPPVVSAVATKELKYIVREPYFRNMIAGVAFMIVFAIVIFLRPMGFSEMGISDSFSRYMVWPATGFVLMMEGQLLMNMLGTEGKSVMTLLLLPASRRQILMGKNLAVVGALTVTNIVVTVIICAVSKTLELTPVVFLWMELVLVLMAGIGNLSSILFPIPIIRTGWRVQAQMTGQGCVHSMAQLLSMGVGGVLLLPVLAAVIVPSYWVSSFYFGLTLPLAIGYVIGVYLLSLHFAAPLMISREPEIINLLVPEEQ